MLAEIAGEAFTIELDVGQLARQHFGPAAHLLGFGTDHGTVAAASTWGGPMEVKRVRPSDPESYERLGHETELPSFLLALRTPRDPHLVRELMEARSERAIGVIYRPETERASHYFHALLPRRFDELVWFDESRAVRPLATAEMRGMAETYPFGL